MERFELNLENLFVDIAMAEGQDFPTLTAELVETFECSFVDVAFAEEDDFTGTACSPHH
jgi:hypothetical protein